MFAPLTAGKMETTDKLWETTVNIPSSSTLRQDQVQAITTIARGD